MQGVTRVLTRLTRSTIHGATFALFASLVLGCAGASPAFKAPPIEPRERPIFDAISIHGLVVRDERVASRTTAVGQSFGTAAAWGPGGTVTATGRGTAIGTSVTLEAFDSPALLRALQLSLEDSRIARRILPESTRFAIDGVFIRNEGATGAGGILWNVVNAGTLLMLFGGPFVGSVEIEVQLRVYDNGELLRTYPGIGRGNWWAIYQLINTIPQGKREAAIEAGQIAVGDAVARLAADPPQIDPAD
jgi:hypothetical protein